MRTKANRRRQRSRQELEQELIYQVKFLRRSIADYDAGDHSEAKRLATTIFTLVHDGSSSRSLLQHLGLRKSLSFYSTALNGPPLPTAGEAGTWMPFGPPLTHISITGGIVSYVPHCVGSTPEKMPEWARPLSFGKWWEEKVSTIGGRPLTRRGLIFALRSQDGGSHVDAALDEDYVELSEQPIPRVPGVTISLQVGGKAAVPPHANWASARQVAWELNHALLQAGL